MSEKISRRQFLKILTATAAGSSLLLYKLFNNNVLKSMAQDMSKKTFLPIVIADTPTPSPEPTSIPPSSTETATDPVPEATNTPSPPSTGSRVVHVRDTDASSWNGSASDYWNYVNQDVVNNMVDQGIMALTGANLVSDAWYALLPNYQPGEGIAIKVSFNNTFNCDQITGKIDSIIEPINAIIRGLISRGVVESDIWIYDAIRAIPDRFISGCQYKNVIFFDNGCNNVSGFTSSDSSSTLQFSPPDGLPSPGIVKVTDVLLNATYLINVPIMKGHSLNGVSLSFKNHFGSINKPGDLHQYIGIEEQYYRSDYSTYVDLYKNINIGNKTILTFGDAIFAAKKYDNAPSTWNTFGNDYPKSFFFATDPVAFDCVLVDYLDTEISLPSQADEYLILASNAGLGTYDRGDPWGNGYNDIDFIKLEL